MELAERILRHLEQHDPVDSVSLAQAWSLDHQKIVGAIKSLECLGDVIRTQIDALKHWELTPEGRQMAQDGSHEALVFQAVPSDAGVPQAELIQRLGRAVGQVGFAKAMSAGWLRIDKSGGEAIVWRKVSSIVDQVQLNLRQVQAGLAGDLSDKAREDGKKRKLLQEVTLKRYRVTRGPKFTLEIKKSETDLTPEMIASGSWKTAEFKPYNFEAMGIQPPAGHLHPLLKVRAEYRQIFLEMGFSEMPTNNFVESSFWNFDALFQPQQHPARDAQDTFFLSDPATSDEFPPEYLERVRQVHSTGGYGSQGYRMDWKLDDARKNVLRTHTTAVSARMLYQLAQSGPFKPQKYFSIDRVFRNETLDATHLAEFHQIEGVIADYGITLGDLVGILYEFFKKLGIEELRFKPAYNPYTEPSMEVFSYHKGLKKWVEIGNSGLFRPEMLLPMGLPEGVNVIGYGLSLERPTMIKYGIDNIRDLCGNKVNLKMVQENPICRLDKDRRNPEATLVQVTSRRWDEITQKLEQLKSKVGGLHSKLDIPEVLVRTPLSLTCSGSNQTSSSYNNIVINADPEHPPYSILPLVKALGSKFVVSAKTHVHSSVVGKLASHCYEFLSINEDQTRPNDGGQLIKISLIWKHGIVRPNIILREGDQFAGEANLARYFARLLNDPSVLPYDECVVDSRLDLDLDNLTQIQYTNPSTIKTFVHGLKATPWLSGKSFSLVDILVWSVINANNIDMNASPLSAWFKKCSNHALLKSL